MVFTSAERRLLALLALLLATGQLIGLVRRPPAPVVLETVAPVPIRRRSVSPFTGGLLDLNRADSLDLIALPGIGPALAGRILAARGAGGRFRALEDLQCVRGIGPQTIARLSGLVTTGCDTCNATCNLH